MAKAAEVSKLNTTAVPVAPPANFIDESRPDIDGWWSSEGNEGKVIYGRIVGAIQFEDKRNRDRMRDAVLIKVYGDTPAMRDKEPVTLKQGEVLALSISHDTQICLSYVEKKGACHLVCGPKKDIGGGQSVRKWKCTFEPGKKSAPVNAPQADEPQPPKSFEGESDNLPF